LNAESLRRFTSFCPITQLRRRPELLELPAGWVDLEFAVGEDSFVVVATTIFVRF
jgi:hypothetical protein